MKLLLTTLLIAAVSFCANANEAPVTLDWNDFRGEVYQTDNLILTGQPLSKKAMEKLASEGVTTIINLRTPQEMADEKSTPIDEAQLAAHLGIRYNQIPSGSPDYPLTSETVDRFAEIYANAAGRVLLHCNSGRRATHLWVAYLISHQGMDVNQAVSLGRSANFGQQPLEGYLDGELEYQLPVSE